MWVICIIIYNRSIINTLIVSIAYEINKGKNFVYDLSRWAIILGISYKEGLKCQKEDDAATRD